ncbi:UbiA prenyltransferase family protein [Prauserella flavalba]|uniref:UbiA prenyltransferase family protein n=1 Tax=Prauserella flavalba TaxID=1477506 RepID=UPI0036EBDB06
MSELTARDVVAVHRLEFPFWVNDVCQSSWGACFAVTAASQLFQAPVLLAIAANFLLIAGGLALNSTADISTDERHPERGSLAHAARRLGKVRGTRWVSFEFAVALALCAVVSVWTGRWIPTAMAVAMIGLQVAYNVEPLRWKRRGFLGVIAFCTAVVGLPCVLSYGAVGAEMSAPVALVFAGLTVLAIGRMTWWSVPDIGADAATGMATPGVRYGAVRALAFACAIMAAGAILLAWGMFLGYGAAASMLAAAAHVVFLVAALGLLRRVHRGLTASSVRMRKRSMPLVMVGDLVVAALPLLA